MARDWGTVTVGRIALREVFAVSESGGDSRKLSVEGQEASPDLTRDELNARHDNLLALEGTLVPVTFTDKPERNGYYTVDSVTATLTEWKNDVLKSDWTLALTRAGTEGETDIQSRLTGAARSNDFSLTGETWHAPPIGHYGYYTFGAVPASMTRTGEDGSVTVYRAVTASASPRWGCDPTDYLAGRVRLLSNSLELTGVDQQVDVTDWQLSNGLIRVVPGTPGSLNVQTYSASAWHDKQWRVYASGSEEVTAFDSATVIHNEPEQVTVRFTKSLSPSGRYTLDLTLRRGSRFVEGYAKRGTSTTFTVRLNTAESFTNMASGGYIVASGDDADGNRFVLGSARNFTTHASGGMQLASATSMDFFTGTVVNGSSPASGDEAAALMNQYIGALPEAIYGVRR